MKLKPNYLYKNHLGSTRVLSNVLLMLVLAGCPAMPPTSAHLTPASPTTPSYPSRTAPPPTQAACIRPDSSELTDKIMLPPITTKLTLDVSDRNSVYGYSDALQLRTEGLAFSILSDSGLRRALSPNATVDDWMTPDAYAYLKTKEFYRTLYLNGEFDMHVADVLASSGFCRIDINALMREPNGLYASNSASTVINKVFNGGMLGQTITYPEKSIPGGSAGRYNILPIEQSQTLLNTRAAQSASFFMNSHNPSVKLIGSMLSQLLQAKVPAEFKTGTCIIKNTDPFLTISNDPRYLSSFTFTYGTGAKGDGFLLTDAGITINTHFVNGTTDYGFNRLIFQEVLNYYLWHMIMSQTLAPEICSN